MKVLHIVTGLAEGGAENQLRLILQHTRHAADVVSLYNPGTIADQLRADGIRVVDLGMRNNREAGVVGRLARFIRAGRYEVVHTHLYRATVYGRLAARLAGTPVIVTTEHSAIDGQLEGRTAGRGVRGLYLAAERLGTATITVSEAVGDELAGWGVARKRLIRIPNGLDLPALAFDQEQRTASRTELGLDESVQILGAVGRLHPNKRFDELLTAAAPLLGDHRHLLLVGEGAERGALEKLAAELGITEHTTFAGERPAAPLLHAMDALAAPSPYETFGLALLEALANGLPVVYRRSPAIDDLTGPRTDGGVAAIGLRAEKCTGDTSAFTAALRRTLDASTRGIPRGCPPALDGYAVARVAAAVDDCYDQLLRSRHPSRWRPAPSEGPA